MSTISAVGHCRLYEPDDLTHPALAPYLRELVPVPSPTPEWPRRDHWEWAMAARALDAHRLLRRDAQVLVLNAGNAPIVFWLTRHVGRVFAVDRYLDDRGPLAGPNPAMLDDPSDQWPAAWDRRRLVAQHDHATSLRMDADRFDAVVWLNPIIGIESSSWRLLAVERCARVLRPGGLLSLAGDHRLWGPAKDPAQRSLLHPEALRRDVLSRAPWRQLGPVEDCGARRLAADAVPARLQREALAAHLEHRRPVRPHELGHPAAPTSALREGGHAWTSVHVALLLGESR